MFMSKSDLTRFAVLSYSQFRYLQVLINSLACGNGNPGCLRNTTEMFQKWRKDEVNNM